MRIYFLSFVVYVSLCSIAYAQQTDSSRVERKFFKESGRAVKSKSEADYVRIIQAIDSGEIKYKFVDYYRDGRKRQGTGIEPAFALTSKSKANTGKSTTIRFHGRVIEYYSNGKRKSITTYKDEVEIGLGYLFYENGNLKEVRDYDNHRILKGRYKVVKLVDSLGRHLLDSTSSGIVVSNNEDFNMEVPYKNGYRHGLQKQYWHKEKINNEVLYKNGEIVSAKRTGGGVSVKIKTSEIGPSTSLIGATTFVGVITDKLRASSVRSAGTEVKGKILVQFYIDKNGSIDNIRLIRSASASPAFTDEIIFVIKSIDKWFPVLANGVPKGTHVTLPVQPSLFPF